MSKREFITDVYDNLMKNTQYKPTDFSKIKEECWFDCDKNEIYIIGGLVDRQVIKN